MEFDIDMGDLKPSLEPVKPICRCCLSTDRRMLTAISYSQYFLDLAGIKVSSSDNLPPWICYECAASLRKAVFFKQKMLKAHIKLSEYLTRCLPFPLDPQDPELSFYATPQLIQTETMSFCNTVKMKDGDHMVLEHKKLSLLTELDDIPLPPLPESQDGGVITNEAIKTEEDSFSDFGDDLPLDQYRLQIDKVEESFSQLLDGRGEIKEESCNERERSSSKKRGRKNGVKIKKKKLIETKNHVKKKERVASVRNKPQDLDPDKIRIIILNPEEQVKQREAESMAGVKFPFHCKLCYKGFNFESKLENHMFKHSKSRGKYTCELCTMYFPSVYSHTTHMYIHTRRYQCVKCDRIMTDRLSIMQHYKTQHEGIITMYTCHLCGKTTNNNKTLRGHIRNHHSGDRPKCDQCGKTFVNKDSLTEHIQIHEGVKNHECNQCGKKFRTRTQIKYHQLTHTNIKDYYCVECDVRFKSAHNLRQHLIKSLKHKDKRNLKFACSQCPRRFDSDSALARHGAVQHLGLRPHACSQCPARLATHNSLAKHTATVHHGRRPPTSHVCHTCGKAFRGKSVLVNHVRTHTGEKPFQCTECGRSFAQRTAMKTHLKLVHMKHNAPSKVKPEFQVEIAENKLFAKEEPTTVMFDNWNRQPMHSCDAYFTVTAHP